MSFSRPPVSNSKGGEKHPAPKESYTRVRDGRAVTPDPYASDNRAVRRNFGR